MDAPQPPGAPGTWPPPPQQSWPQPAPPARPYNRLAVGAFASVLLFPLALVLGIVALARLSRAGNTERGRGLAIAALAVAGAEIAALSVIVPVAVFAHETDGDRAREDVARRERPDDGEPPSTDPGQDTDRAGEEISVYNLRVGDCFDSGQNLAGNGAGNGNGDGTGAVQTVTRLPCDVPHEAEAYGTVEVTGHDSFPGSDELSDLAYRECGELLQPYVVDVWTLGTDIQTFSFFPQETSWRLGDREILCALARTEGSALTFSLRGDASALNDEQLAYLEITTPLEVVIWNEPQPDEPLRRQRQWAEEMTQTIAAEADALRAHEWSASVSGLVSDLVAARERSLEPWEAAAGARNLTEFNSHYAEGWETLGLAEEVAVRQVLGLATGE